MKRLIYIIIFLTTEREKSEIWSLTLSGKHCSIKLSWMFSRLPPRLNVDVGFTPASALCWPQKTDILMFPMAAD